MAVYDHVNYAVPDANHDIAKAFLQGLDARFEISEMGGDECCFALYDLCPEQAYAVKCFFEQECGAAELPF